MLLDIAANPGSSISEITARTGYPQSHVSTSVIKLRHFGAVRTEVDPRDRRRTLVWVVPETVRRAHSRITSTADAAIARGSRQSTGRRGDRSNRRPRDGGGTTRVRWPGSRTAKEAS